jgi:hypothetical protein
MKTVIISMIAAAAMAATPAAAQPARPVLLGTPGPFRTACAFGDISGLNPRGDNFLAVRAAPSLRAREIDRLWPRRQQVMLCERTRDGRWYGIVYRHNNSCEVEVPRGPPRPYRGRCRSGWVSARYITVSAG